MTSIGATAVNPLLCTACKPDARRRAVRVVGTQCTSTHTHCKPTIGCRALYHTLGILLGKQFSQPKRQEEDRNQKIPQIF